MSEPLPSPIKTPQELSELFVGKEPEPPMSAEEAKVLLEQKAAEKPFIFFLSKRGEDAPPTTLFSDNLKDLFSQAQKLMLQARRGYAFFLIYGIKCPVCYPRQVFAIVRPDGKKDILVEPDNWVSDESGAFEILVDMPKDIE